MCGIFGFVNYGRSLRNGENLLEKLAWESSIRGTDATGYSFINKDKLHVTKAAKKHIAWNTRYPKAYAQLWAHKSYYTRQWKAQP